MGKNKWMSKSSSRKGCNLRAPATARHQGGGSVLQVHWTPVFARGKLRIFMCDPALAADPQHPQKLNDSENLSKFVKNYLPGVLQEMKDEFGWSTLPRAVVHDKASYMVSTGHNRLHVVFAAGLKSGGFSSWIGNDAANAQWLVAKWGTCTSTRQQYPTSVGCWTQTFLAHISTRRQHSLGADSRKWKIT
jgi:hypothetical protein